MSDLRFLLDLDAAQIVDLIDILGWYLRATTALERDAARCSDVEKLRDYIAGVQGVTPQ